jgi:hypothetical protein
MKFELYQVPGSKYTLPIYLKMYYSPQKEALSGKLSPSSHFKNEVALIV